MRRLPAVFPDGQTPERDGPWFLMGLIRKHFRWLRDGRSPLAVLETAVSMLLGYWIVPATLLLFWVRYLVRQDFRGTLLHVVLDHRFGGGGHGIAQHRGAGAATW